MPIIAILLLTLAAHAAEISLSRYSRHEQGVLSKEYDMEGGRAYWINGVSILGLPDAGADVMGFSEPGRRLPLGFSGIYTPPPVYERYGLSLNASNGNLIFKENYNPIDTPITTLLWERYGLEGNAFRLNFNRQLLDSIVFSLGLATHSVARSGDFYYQDIVHQLYTGTMRRDSARVPLAGRNLTYSSLHFVPAISWLFPNSNLTVQTSFLYLDNDDATRDFFERDISLASISFQNDPYNIKGGSSFYRALWNYAFLPNWELSLSHRLAYQELRFSDIQAAENYSAQTGEGRVLHKAFLNPYIKVNYEYLRNTDSSFYQDRQLLLLGINDSLWKFAFRGESGLQRNASAFDSVDFAPAISLGLTMFLPWHLEFGANYQSDTRFPDMQETRISRAGRISFPDSGLKAEKRQRAETSIKYNFSERFFYLAGFRYERSKNAIMPHWAVPTKPWQLDSLLRDSTKQIRADSVFRWANADVIQSSELFWRLGFELGNWCFYAEQGKAFARTFMPILPSRYYKGAVYWSNRFVEERLKVSALFDADWFGSRWDYGLRSESMAKPILLKHYLSLNLKISMQIQDFTLFARIENMNHSLMEPEPGYAPPGIRFAYGIEWLLGD